MSAEAYPLQGLDKDEELLTFSGCAEEQACIGHLRGDLAGGRSSGPHGGTTRKS